MLLDLEMMNLIMEIKRSFDIDSAGGKIASTMNIHNEEKIVSVIS